MKVKLLTTISFLTYQLSISQTEKLLHGKVIDQSFALKGVEVINKTALTSTRTNEFGQFSILVSPKDSLLFFHKDYYFARFMIMTENIQTNNFIVKMILKPEELDEVVLTKVKIEKVKYDAEALAEIDLEKRKSDLKRFIPVNDGTIANGMNFLGSGPTIFDMLRKKEPKSKNKAPELGFLKFVESTVPLDFFSKDLKLKPEDKELFLQFCDSDPESETVLKQKNLLFTMDFLYKKNEAFKKLK